MAQPQPQIQVTEALSSSSMRVMVFAWNADGVRLCRTLAQDIEKEKQNEFIRGYTTNRYDCATPDFFRTFIGQVESVHPHMVIVATQGEPTDGTYLHSDFLPARMPEHGYRLLSRAKLDNVGLGSSNLPVNGQKMETAERLSVYAAAEEFVNFSAQSAAMDKLFGSDHSLNVLCRSGVARSSGALATYVSHPVFGRFCFINVDLPESSDILSVRRGALDYDSYRDAIKAANTLCLINMQNHFYYSMPEEARPEHVIVFGDFNYEIRIPGKSAEEVAAELVSKPNNEFLRKVISDYDEFSVAKSATPLKGYKEGPSNEGPLFPPTYWLHRDRTPDCQRGFVGISGEGSASGSSSGKVGSSCYDITSFHYPSWRERAIYKDMGSTPFVTHCTYYQSIDVGNMRQSRHAGVVGVYVIKRM